MTVNRELQGAILRKLEETYPEPFDCQAGVGGASSHEALADLCYLQEHGLINLVYDTYMDTTISRLEAKITARGIDFLAGDGGLGAILNVLTVKIHEDTLRGLLIQQVTSAEGDESVKEKLVEQLKSLPAEGLSHLVTKALDAGLKAMPDVVRWLQTTPWS